MFDLPLHQSPYYLPKHDGRELLNCDRYAETLIRLPFYNELSAEDQKQVIREIEVYFGLNS